MYELAYDVISYVKPCNSIVHRKRYTIGEIGSRRHSYLLTHHDCCLQTCYHFAICIYTGSSKLTKIFAHIP